MSREKRPVDTKYGPTLVDVIVCEACGAEVASEDVYVPADSWFKITSSKPGKSYRSRIEQDFCSVDCVVGTLVPDIYSSDPAAVMRAISNLKRIEKDLDDPRKGLPVK